MQKNITTKIHCLNNWFEIQTKKLLVKYKEIIAIFKNFVCFNIKYLSERTTDTLISCYINLICNLGNVSKRVNILSQKCIGEPSTDSV